jgi:hypothetical protein
MVEFSRTENLLDELTQYEIFRFCRLGLNWLKFYRTKILDKNQISADRDTLSKSLIQLGWNIYGFPNEIYNLGSL